MSYIALAAIELTLLGLLSGVAGTLIVLRRRSFFAVALSHATFPGGVVFAILGYNLLIGQALFAVLLVLLLTLLSRVPGQGRQVASGVVLAFGFALGTLLANLNQGLGVPVDALLVGSVLSVSTTDVLATAVVLLVSAIACAVLWRRVVMQAFDAPGFAAVGFRALPLELATSAVIAAAVVVSMPAVGAILGVALLIGPAAAARVLAPNVNWMPALAAAIGVAAGLAGLWISGAFNVAAGGAVGLTSASALVLAYVTKWIVARARALGSTSKPASSGSVTRSQEREVTV